MNLRKQVDSSGLVAQSDCNLTPDRMVTSVLHIPVKLYVWQRFETSGGHKEAILQDTG